MEAKIVRIGNSKGLRISKAILDQYDIKDKVEIILEKEHIVLKPIKKPREGWIEQFRAAGANSEAELLIPDVFEDEDFEEWS